MKEKLGLGLKVKDGGQGVQTAKGVDRHVLDQEARVAESPSRSLS